MAKRGLIVSYYFPPAGGGGVQRWTKFIKYLSRWDWEFTVVTTEPESSQMRDEKLLAEIPDSTKIIRLKSEEPANGRKKRESRYWERWLSAAVHITDSRSAWNQYALKAVTDELKQAEYDAIFVTTPPYSLSGLAARLTGEQSVPVILDMRDPWTTNPFKIYPSRFHRKRDENIETKLIGSIKHFCFAYESTYVDYFHKSKLQNQATHTIIPNGYDEEDFTGLQAQALPNPDVFNIAFSGTFYSHLNHPKYLLAVLEKCASSGNKICFHHLGSSAHDLESLIKTQAPGIEFKSWGYLEHHTCLELLQAMDAFALILDDHWPNAEKTAGGKLYEYLRFRKPIFALAPTGGEAGKVIKNCDAGSIVSAHDVAGAASVLNKWVNGQLDFSFRGIEDYNREKQAFELFSYLQNIVQK